MMVSSAHSSGPFTILGELEFSLSSRARAPSSSLKPCRNDNGDSTARSWPPSPSAFFSWLLPFRSSPTGPALPPRFDLTNCCFVLYYNVHQWPFTCSCPMDPCFMHQTEYLSSLNTQTWFKIPTWAGREGANWNWETRHQLRNALTQTEFYWKIIPPVVMCGSLPGWSVIVYVAPRTWTIRIMVWGREICFAHWQASCTHSGCIAQYH